ncbi:S41 family peptidase [Deinococcus sp. Arct2-2]|uniref:S41 family peptidase n=1 Tax=Deinococcus sp. Arct2-2 TaxID=2568653 RepID=UPI0010A48B36|nr:S41 family peptidase [Deinococcus sp. Arct2-2]THF69107.1 S41 family peptidase [Deinococcus sp. Arct2-2]
MFSLPALAQSQVGRPGSATSTQFKSAASVSPAQAVFDQVNLLLQTSYGGLSPVDREGLAREYQLRLDAVCAPTPTNCAAEKSYPVIEAEMTALDDEHTFFQTPEDFQEFVASATGGNRRQFGVKLALLDGQQRVVLEVVPNSVAAGAGLLRGDVLTSIDGQPYTYDALRAAREAGRPIALGVSTRGLERVVNLTSQESSTRDLPRLSYQASADGSQDVAVIRIPTFISGGGVAQGVHDLVGEARARGVRGIIVDLRGNGGGSLSECDGAVSAFVPSFTRVARSAEGNSRTLVSRGARVEAGRTSGIVTNPQLWTGPLSVLVDGGSASCSEFFAFEIQNAARGPILGETTAGVGNTATRVFPIGEDAALQLTILNYAKPDGTPYPTRLTPDIADEQSEATTRLLTQGEDELLNLGVKALDGAPVLSQERGQPGSP